MNATKQCLELSQAACGIFRVIRTDIEVILDGVRAPSQPLEQIGIVGWETDGGVIGAGCLAQHAGKPEVCESHFLERSEGSRIDVIKSARAIFDQCAVQFARYVGIAEEPHK